MSGQTLILKGLQAGRAHSPEHHPHPRIISVELRLTDGRHEDDAEAHGEGAAHVEELLTRRAHSESRQT